MSKDTAAQTIATTDETGEGVIKHDDFDINKDWSYLADKEPDSGHVLKAELINRFGPEGFNITAKQIQVFLAMHRWVQKSDAKQSREGFHGRKWSSVEKGYATLAERAAKMIATEGEDAVVVSNPNITGLSAKEVLAAAESALADPEASPEEKEVAAAEVTAQAEAEAKPEPKKTQARKPRQPRKTAAQRKAEEAATVAE